MANNHSEIDRLMRDNGFKFDARRDVLTNDKLVVTHLSAGLVDIRGDWWAWRGPATELLAALQRLPSLQERIDLLRLELSPPRGPGHIEARSRR